MAAQYKGFVAEKESEENSKKLVGEKKLFWASRGFVEKKGKGDSKKGSPPRRKSSPNQTQKLFSKRGEKVPFI